MQASGLVVQPLRLRPAPEVLAPSPRRITEGLVVSLNYVLQLEDGTTVESVRGHPPFLYLHGAGNVVPGLEKELTNRRVGDRLSLEVPPELGYGTLDPKCIQRLHRSEFPPDARLTPGMRFGSELDDGTILPAWVADVQGDDIIVHFSHPLAGKNLHFLVEVLGVRDARPDELRHGHPHGPGGVQH